MKYLLIVIVTMLIGCNPFMTLDTATKSGISNSVIDAITTDLIIRTIDDETKIEEIKTVSIPSIMLNNYLEAAEEWLGEFRYKGGYACLCAYFELTKIESAIELEFFISKIENIEFKWGSMRIPISDEKWNSISYMFPSGVVRNTDVYVTFKK